MRNDSHQIPHWDVSKIHIYLLKVDILSTSLSLILDSINSTSLSKLEYMPTIGVYYMSGTGLITDNTERNETWVNFSHVIRNLTVVGEREEKFNKRGRYKAYALSEYEVDNCLVGSGKASKRR